MRIVVVDDNARFAEEVIRAVEEFFAREGEKAETQYLGGRELLERLEEGQSIDICLLDVEMPEMDGLTLAKKIRERNEDVRIVFLTAHDKYAISGYEVKADGYVLKGHFREEMPPVLRRICAELRKNEGMYYIFQTETESHRFQVDDILYLEKEQKYTIFHCTRGREYRQRETLDNILQKLPQGQFQSIDKGIAANLSNVMSCAEKMLTLRDGTKLHVSRRTWQQVKDQVYALWRKK